MSVVYDICACNYKMCAPAPNSCTNWNGEYNVTAEMDDECVEAAFLEEKAKIEAANQALEKQAEKMSKESEKLQKLQEDIKDVEEQIRLAKQAKEAEERKTKALKNAAKQKETAVPKIVKVQLRKRATIKDATRQKEAGAPKIVEVSQQKTSETKGPNQTDAPNAVDDAGSKLLVIKQRKQLEIERRRQADALKVLADAESKQKKVEEVRRLDIFIHMLKEIEKLYEPEDERLQDARHSIAPPPTNPKIDWSTLPQKSRGSFRKKKRQLKLLPLWVKSRGSRQFPSAHVPRDAGPRAPTEASKNPEGKGRKSKRNTGFFARRSACRSKTPKQKGAEDMEKNRPNT